MTADQSAPSEAAGLSETLAEALHRYVCAEPWDACCWGGDDPDFSDCHLPDGSWRPTGVEPALEPILAARTADHAAQLRAATSAGYIRGYGKAKRGRSTGRPGRCCRAGGGTVSGGGQAPEAGHVYAPMFGEPVSPWWLWFAWRPVETVDRGKRWLCFVWRRRCQKHSYLDGGADFWFQHAVYLPLSERACDEA